MLKTLIVMYLTTTTTIATLQRAIANVENILNNVIRHCKNYEIKQFEFGRAIASRRGIIRAPNLAMSNAYNAQEQKINNTTNLFLLLPSL